MLAQLSERYSLHTNQISDWKKTLLEGSSLLFKRSSTKPDPVDLDALRVPYLEQSLNNLTPSKLFIEN
jgi:transposase-like protein